MSKTFQELVTDAVVAFISQPKNGSMGWVTGDNIVPIYEKVAEGLVLAAKRNPDFVKAMSGELK